MNIIINNAQKAESFTGIFQHMKAFTESINIMFEKERMYVQSMDHSRVSIFELFLPAEWFDTYEHTQPGTIVIGINSTILFKMLNTRDKSQQIHLQYTTEEDKLSLHFTGENKADFDKHFEVSLMEIDSEMMTIPEIEYQAEFTIGSVNFASIINQLKMFGDSLDITCSEEKIMLYSSNLEQGKMFVEIKMDDLSSFIIDEGSEINLSYSLNLMHNICLYNKLAKDIEVKFSADYPMKIVYLLGGHEDAKIIFFLAPKINDQD